MARDTASDRASWSGADRRRHPRTTADWPLVLQLEGQPVHARLRDVSRSGLCFFLDRPIAEMTVLALDFEYPGPEGPAHVRARGAVVRCERLSEALDHWEVAVFLHEIDPRSAEHIDAFVRARGE